MEKEKITPDSSSYEYMIKCHCLMLQVQEGSNLLQKIKQKKYVEQL